MQKEEIGNNKKRVGGKTSASEIAQALAESKKKIDEARKLELLEEEKSAIEQAEMVAREKKYKEEIVKKKQEQMSALEHAASKTAEILAAAQKKGEAIASKALKAKQPIPVDELSKRYTENAKQETASVLKKQMEERKLREIQEKKRNEDQAKQWILEADKQREQEESKKVKTKMALQQNKEVLQNQMDEKKKKGKFGMSKEEYLVNRQLLVKAKGEAEIADSPDKPNSDN